MTEERYPGLSAWLAELERASMSRRQVLERLAAAGVSMSAASALVGATEGSAAAATLGSAATPRRGGTLNFGWNEEVPSLDPHTSPSYSSINFFHMVYSRMFKYNAKMQPVGDLVRSWSISNDGRTYTFKLKPNAKFSNGDPLTSADIQATFRRIQNKKTAAIGASFFTGLTSVTTPDPDTVVFRLSQPSAALLVYLARPETNIVSAKLIQSGADFSKIDNAIGSGPWKVDNWVPDNYMALSRNPYFYEPDRPYIDNIRVSIIPNMTSLLAAVRGGSVDFTWTLTASVGRQASASPNINVIRTPDLSYYLLFMNTQKPYFNKVEVRQALSYAIDREAIIKAANLGEGVPVAPIPVGLPGYALPTSHVPMYHQDLNKARALLKKAGYPNGFNFQMIAPTTEPDNAPAIATTVQSQIKEVGIKASVQTMEFTTWVNHWLKATFNMTPGVNSGAPDPDYYFFRYWYSKGDLNFVSGHFHTPTLDRLLLRGRADTHAAARKKVYRQVQQILINQAPWLWLYSGYNYSLLGKRVHGYVPRSDESLTGLRDAWLSS